MEQGRGGESEGERERVRESEGERERVRESEGAHEEEGVIHTQPGAAHQTKHTQPSLLLPLLPRSRFRQTPQCVPAEQKRRGTQCGGGRRRMEIERGKGATFKA